MSETGLLNIISRDAFLKFGLGYFYGISTIVGYLKPNPVYTETLNTWFGNTFCGYTQLNDPIFLFLTIQFNISQQR